MKIICVLSPYEKGKIFFVIKGTLTSFRTTFIMYNINKAMIQIQTSCSQRKKRSPEHCLKLGRWQGLPHVNKLQRDEIVLSFKVSFSLINIYSPKLHSDPLSLRKCPRAEGEHSQK